MTESKKRKADKETLEQILKDLSGLRTLQELQSNLISDVTMRVKNLLEKS